MKLTKSAILQNMSIKRLILASSFYDVWLDTPCDHKLPSRNTMISYYESVGITSHQGAMLLTITATFEMVTKVALVVIGERFPFKKTYLLLTKVIGMIGLSLAMVVATTFPQFVVLSCGAIYDKFGSYRVSFLIVATTSLVSALSLSMVLLRQKLVRRRSEVSTGPRQCNESKKNLYLRVSTETSVYKTKDTR
ncbi:hypothetical protein BSL78_20188 [Apostichopus japonicus]|uniref:Uncharacterized protein n=1 Tax=Stichopus japonicus TaxID=307972 RepID=A0A2G8K4N1_STIJA|nr:hypothetical protein BSL78_20188 [Apostichopus japonicus]